MFSQKLSSEKYFKRISSKMTKQYKQFLKWRKVQKIALQHCIYSKALYSLSDDNEFLFLYWICNLGSGVLIL